MNDTPMPPDTTSTITHTYDFRPKLNMCLMRAREEAGLTHRDLARMSGLSAQSINKLEQGVYTNPRLYEMLALSEALHVPVATLFPPLARPASTA